MYPPVDYPLKASQEKASQEDVQDAADITYAALLDRYNSEQPITHDMIQQACQKMDEAQQYPFPHQLRVLVRVPASLPINPAY